MLNGIGGRTIAEAKERMSCDEFEAWMTYIARHGSLNPGLRVEDGAALVAYIVHRSAGGTLDHDNFLPVRQMDDAAELEKAMSTWR